MPVAGPYIYPNTQEGWEAGMAKATRLGLELKETHGGKAAVLGEEVSEKREQEADAGSEGEGEGVGQGGGKAVSEPRRQRKSRKG